MNKKLLKSFAAAAMSVLAIACAKEQVGPVEGAMVEATFSVDVPGVIGTKAGEGTKATKLYYQVFDAEGAPVTGLPMKVKDIHVSTTVNFQLIKDQTYNFVFWAQTAEAGYYTVTDLRTITANYEGKNSNDENFDAFFAVEKAITINGPITKTVTLKRPFAQINVATTGVLKAGETTVNVDFTGATSAVTVKDVPTVFSPLTDKLSSPVNALQFASAAIPEGNFAVTGSTETYKYLAVNYVFAPVDGTVYDVEAALNVAGKDVTVKVPSVPAKRNYRTNIYGNLLTTTADFNVEIDPGFAGDENISPIIVNGVAYQTLDAAVAAAKTGEQTIIALSQDMAGNGVKTIKGQDVVIDLGGHTFDIDGSLVGSTGTETSGFQLLKGSKVTFKNGTLKSKKASLLIQNYSDLTLENVTLDATGGVALYVLSNNHGTVKIIGSSSILAPEGKHAFDVYYWPPAYSDGVNVYVNTTGIIRGAIEYACFNDEAEDACNKKTSLVIEKAVLEDSKLETKLMTPNIKIARSLFTNEAAAAAWIPAGYKLRTDGDYYGISLPTVASQEELNAAIADVAEGETATVTLGAGEFTTYDNTSLKGKNVTVSYVGAGADKTTFAVGTDNHTNGEANGDYSLDGVTKASFKNMTIKVNNDDYRGYIRVKELEFENCVFENRISYWGEGKVTFKNCTFNQTAEDYNLWTYSGTDFLFDGCTFNSPGKCINAYKDGGQCEYKITIRNCHFVSTKVNKSVVELKANSSHKYTLCFEGENTSDNFKVSELTGSALYNSNKGEKDSSVFVDGVQVWTDGHKVE